MDPRILILNPVIPRPPALCDVEDCGSKARYSLGNLYLCAPCLIAACMAGFVKGGDDQPVYRVPEYQEGT